MALDTAGHPQGDLRPAGHFLDLQVLVRQSQPLLKGQLSRARVCAQGLKVLQAVRDTLGLPVLTDVHEDTPPR